MTLRVRGLSKSYAGVPVLKNVDLEVADGEIHALLGANGAGKSTLIKCLSGATQPDEGAIRLDSEEYFSFTPRSARTAGVAVIYQEPNVIRSLNISDNVFLGCEMRSGPFIQHGVQQAETKHWLNQLGVDLDPTMSAASATNAEMQIVEIVRSLRLKPRLLILDEPTAALTEREAEHLGERLLELKAQKLPVLYVTHRLGEVFALADRFTVMREGKIVLTGAVADVTKEEILHAITGRVFSTAPAARDRNGSDKEDGSEPLLKVNGLVAGGIGPIDLDVRLGEMVGFFGLLGAGRTEFLETLAGARKRHAGSVTLKGTEIHPRSPTQALGNGIVIVPSDRLHYGLVSGISAQDNLLLPSFGRLARFGLRRFGAERRAFDMVARKLALHPFRRDLDGRQFSGGNQQKLVVGRWLTGEIDCKVMLLDEPTQGVDVGARRDLYDALIEFTSNGRAVLMASSEPDELVQLCSRVIVLSRGNLVGQLVGSQITEHNLLTLAHANE